MRQHEALAIINAKVLYDYGPISKDDIMEYVKHEDWQEWRLKMKGHSTRRKLQMCALWYHRRGRSHAAYVQVTNYINALKRGGQIK